MSRGGRGFGRGRGGFAGGSTLPPMGLTHADIQAMSREATAMYPPMRAPVLSDVTDEEKKIAQYQTGFATRLRHSQYYVIEVTKSTELPRYSDRYSAHATTQPKLKRKELHEPFFPKDILADYFNPKRKKVSKKQTATSQNVNMSDFEEESEKSEGEASVADSAEASDYDVDEEYDNDYADNYFDNGEGDDNDHLDVADNDGGGGGDYD